jgi:hypothetical protein
MGPGRVFYSLAAFVAVVAVLRRAGELVQMRQGQAVALGLALALMSSGWVVRARRSPLSDEPDDVLRQE